MWNESRKPVGIELPADLHRAVKVEAAKRGMQTQEAYEQGMTAWLYVTSVRPGQVDVPEPEGEKIMEKVSELSERMKEIEQIVNRLKASKRRRA